MDNKSFFPPPDPPIASYSLVGWTWYALRYLLWVLLFPIRLVF